MHNNFLKNITLLYVEDDESIQRVLARRLEKMVKTLYVADDGDDGFEQFQKYQPDMVLTDVTMPKQNGIDMAKQIKEINENMPIIVLSAHGESSILLDSIEVGITGYLLKPINKDKLYTMLENTAKTVCLEKINMQQQEQIIEQKIILQNILDSEKSITVVTDFHTISFVNKEFLNFFNIENIEDFEKQHTSVLEVFQPHEDYLHKGLLQENTSAKALYSLIENTDETKRIVLLLNQSLEPKAYYINISLLEENKELYLINLMDITKMTIEKIDTQKKAYIDNLTGVKNRNKFVECFNEELLRVQRYNHPLTVAILDIDHFKKFNDTYGHLVGDEVLTLIATTINENVRTTDVFARWGGEEFIILFTDTKLDAAVLTSNILREKVENLEHKTAGKVTVSFGLAQYEPKDTLESLFKRCDDLLYKAKENGRNRVES